MDERPTLHFSDLCGVRAACFPHLAELEPLARSNGEVSMLVHLQGTSKAYIGFSHICLYIYIHIYNHQHRDNYIPFYTILSFYTIHIWVYTINNTWVWTYVIRKPIMAGGTPRSSSHGMSFLWIKHEKLIGVDVHFEPFSYACIYFIHLHMYKL